MLSLSNRLFHKSIHFLMAAAKIKQLFVSVLICNRASHGTRFTLQLEIMHVHAQLSQLYANR